MTITATRCTAVALLMVAAIFLWVGQSKAACVYNNSDKDWGFNIDFDDGFNDFFVLWPDYSKCWDGKGGRVSVSRGDPYQCDVQVDKDGRVTLTRDGNRYKLMVHFTDGSAGETCYVNP